ncbi:hypothetical protein [Sorangium sp. So ce1182]|uniref:hypothetical protein n=1 Tax=Sorangium sp. So ce1182 TaxID=3133334 RepID=UPI003F605E2B
MTTFNEPEHINRLWQDAIRRDVSRGTLAIGPGGDYRLDVRKSLEALGKTLSVALGLEKGIDASTTSASVLKLGLDALFAVISLREAVFTRLTPLQLLTCMILVRSQESKDDGLNEAEGADQSPTGLTREALAKELAFYTTIDTPELFPWYLGVDRAYLEKARSALGEDGAIDNTISKLKELNRVSEDSEGRLFFVDKFVSLRLTD